jgi:arginine/ornithine N-succinyltransferase beta subunit
MLTLSSTSSTRPRREKAIVNGLFPRHPLFPRLLVQFAPAKVVENHPRLSA